MSYTVHIETRASAGDTQVVSYDAIDALMDLLAPHEGIVSGGPEWTSWDATVGVDAADPAEALNFGAGIVLEYAEKAGLPSWPTVKAEVVRDDVLEEELSKPNIPDLVSGPEAAAVLGVSKQRVHQLAAEHPDFPKPLYELAAGKLWDRGAIERFREQWARKPGRPRKEAS